MAVVVELQPVIRFCFVSGACSMGGTACAKAAFTHGFTSGVAPEEENYLINSWPGDAVQPEHSICAQHGVCNTIQFVTADYFLADVESLPVSPQLECKTGGNHPAPPPVSLRVSFTDESGQSCSRRGS